jgi:hypothetical protein
MITVSKRRLLTAVVAMLMVGSIASASASAAVEPYFKVEKGGVTTTLASGETRTQTFSMPAEGRIYVPGASLAIACTNASGSGLIYNNWVGATRKEGRLKEAKVTFEGCSVVGQPKCFINGAVSGAGKITTNAISARIGYQTESTENIEAVLVAENAEKLFATVKITECALENNYKITGQLVVGIGPSNTLFEKAVEGGTTITGEIQQYKTIQFPVAAESLTGQELKFGAKTAAVEGALEIGLSTAGEKVGFYTS